MQAAVVVVEVGGGGGGLEGVYATLRVARR